MHESPAMARSAPPRMRVRDENQDVDNADVPPSSGIADLVIPREGPDPLRADLPIQVHHGTSLLPQS